MGTLRSQEARKWRIEYSWHILQYIYIHTNLAFKLNPLFSETLRLKGSHKHEFPIKQINLSKRNYILLYFVLVASKRITFVLILKL